MKSEQELIAEQIRNAFDGVSLGNGLGLREANAMDDYASEENLANLRKLDEKHDWSRITAEELNQCPSSLAFFDPEGMRFHLPAVLLAELDGSYDHEVVFYLTFLEQENPSRFILLDPLQRQAIRDFLLLQLNDSPEYSDHPEKLMIQHALTTVWPDVEAES